MTEIDRESNASRKSQSSSSSSSSSSEGRNDENQVKVEHSLERQVEKLSESVERASIDDDDQKNKSQAYQDPRSSQISKRDTDSICSNDNNEAEDDDDDDDDDCQDTSSDDNSKSSSDDDDDDTDNDDIGNISLMKSHESESIRSSYDKTNKSAGDIALMQKIDDAINTRDFIDDNNSNDKSIDDDDDESYAYHTTATGIRSAYNSNSTNYFNEAANKNAHYNANNDNAIPKATTNNANTFITSKGPLINPTAEKTSKLRTSSSLTAAAGGASATTRRASATLNPTFFSTRFLSTKKRRHDSGNAYLSAVKESHLMERFELSKYVNVKDTDTVNSLKHKLVRLVKPSVRPVVVWNIGVKRDHGPWYSDKTLVKDIKGDFNAKIFTTNKLTHIKMDKSKRSKEYKLLEAIRHKATSKEISALLKNIKNVNFSDFTDPLIHQAIAYGADFEIIQEIIMKQAVLDVRDSHSDTPHLCALRHQRPDVFKLLVSHCPEMMDSCNRGKIYPVQMAIICCSDSIASDIIKFFLEQNRDIRCKYSSALSPVSLSCVCNKPRCTYYLLKNGLSVSRSEFYMNMKLCKYANNPESMINLFISHGHDTGNDKAIQMNLLRELQLTILDDRPALFEELLKIVPENQDWVDGDRMEYVMPPEKDTYFFLSANDIQQRLDKLGDGKKFVKRVENRFENALDLENFDFKTLAADSECDGNNTDDNNDNSDGDDDHDNSRRSSRRHSTSSSVSCCSVKSGVSRRSERSERRHNDATELSRDSRYSTSSFDSNVDTELVDSLSMSQSLDSSRHSGFIDEELSSSSSSTTQKNKGNNDDDNDDDVAKRDEIDEDLKSGRSVDRTSRRSAMTG